MVLTKAAAKRNALNICWIYEVHDHRSAPLLSVQRFKMFTEGLDESAINWVKQGTGIQQQPRSPLAEKVSVDSISDPVFWNTKNLLSPRVLPPPKFHSSLLGRHSTVNIHSDEDDESIGSVADDYSDTYEGSSDSELFEKSGARIYDEEVFGVKFSRYLNGKSENVYKRTLIRGVSKENLRIDVPSSAQRTTGGKLNEGKDSASSYDYHTPHCHLVNDVKSSNIPDLGTPSAPPIMEIGREESQSEDEGEHRTHVRGVTQAFSAPITPETCNEMQLPKETKDWNEHLPDQTTQSHRSSEPYARSVTTEIEQQLPNSHIRSMDQLMRYNTSSQNAWQTLIAYDACFRLCLNAWARDCMEAPEFLRDECMVLRTAFGLQKYLLQPRGQQIPREAGPSGSLEENCSVRTKKAMGKIRVEVKKVRIIPRRKLRSTFSHRGSLYKQVGAEYVRHVSSLLKTSINSLKIPSLAVTSEETLSCLFQLKSSSEEASTDLSSSLCLRPGLGDSHLFFPESQGDALLVEVQDANRVTQGRTTLQISTLIDSSVRISAFISNISFCLLLLLIFHCKICQNDGLRWWPIYHEDQECVGKVQLLISSTSISAEPNAVKSGPVVETLTYDFVLEAALRAQRFHSRNLRLHGPWKWLLDEFAEYYGVTDAYTKLRYLSYVMEVATPTKDCLELVYELLVPVIKARAEKNLTRQERSILLDSENQVENLLAKVFENYKSLDELCPTGLEEKFGPPPESAAPALIPAVQIYSLLHDILSHDAQMTLRNYLQKAAMKRCRRHMVDTDEFMSSNGEGFLVDPITISTAYVKMKTLCTNISSEIQADIKIHNQHILPSSIDLPNLAASVYSAELCNRLRGFLSACPPSGPLLHVTELLMATADFERDLISWNISLVPGGVNSKVLFHHYIVVWIEEKMLYLLDLCKADKAPWSGVTTHLSTSPFVEDMYDKIKDTLSEYETVVNRWPQYCLTLENAIATVERAVVKALEKHFCEILAPLKDSIPKKLGIQVQKLTRRQSQSLYHVPNQLGAFLNTVKRILDVLHCRVEDTLRPWASCLPIIGDQKTLFGEQLNEITVMLRTKYKNYTQATVEKLVSNTQANRNTRLKKILEETKEADGQAEIRDRMQMLTTQLIDSISNLHDVFSSRIFVAICRVFWDRMGQIVLSFLESRKENRIWYKGSYYALAILDDTFASQMQRLEGNSLQEKDLEPPRSVTEARSILCRDSPNTADPSAYFYY
ncbi:hypothetical protein H6P81_008796 [Aristolochia fimbriata]|uniref:MHD1 domain-containing protein n=1 Tax=Aristolochia fimbriata TaxID=158543 RepID=A0AAV7EMD3_ARIFI|nr:hypothetical protein H6P81_008796 [Aristolochia fimbriata]